MVAYASEKDILNLERMKKKHDDFPFLGKTYLFRGDRLFVFCLVLAALLLWWVLMMARMLPQISHLMEIE